MPIWLCPALVVAVLIVVVLVWHNNRKSFDSLAAKLDTLVQPKKQ